MTTYLQLVDEIVGNLQGFTAAPDQMTFLTNSITNSDTSILVNDITQVGSGVAEVDSELVYVQGVDTGTSTVTVAPFGRGYKSTTAASHTANAAFTMSPSWPRSAVKREVNRAILALYPTLYAVRDAALITTNGITYQFDVPLDCERIVDVRWLVEPLDGWQRAVQWEQENAAPSTFPNDHYISIYDAIPGGASVQVVYAARPTQLVGDSDDYTAVSGMEEATADLIVYAVCAKMAQFVDVGRLPTTTASADALAAQRPLGGPTQIAASLKKDYAIRLEQEARALALRFPLRPHKVR